MVAIQIWPKAAARDYQIKRLNGLLPVSRTSILPEIVQYSELILDFGSVGAGKRTLKVCNNLY
jgi:hypothetical protein